MKKKTIFIIIIFSLVVLGGIGAVVGWFAYQTYRAGGKEKLAAIHDVAEFTKAVGNAVLLPVGEDPVVATVSDKTKLGRQFFFRSAENGDKVFIYTQSSKAILYRPSIHKIVEIASIQGIDGTSQQPTQEATPLPTPMAVTLAIYNGTTTTGLTKKAEKQITAAIPDMTITDKSTAKKSDYVKTLIFAVQKTHEAVLTQLALLLGADVFTTLPPGEILPNTDVLIILGANAQ